MAKLKALMRLTRIRFKKIKKPVKFVAIAALGGGIGASATAQSGLRKPAAKEGAVSAAATTALAIATGAIIFRRIRGRIIPIRRKLRGKARS